MFYHLQTDRQIDLSGKISGRIARIWIYSVTSLVEVFMIDRAGLHSDKSVGQAVDVIEEAAASATDVGNGLAAQVLGPNLGQGEDLKLIVELQVGWSIESLLELGPVLLALVGAVRRTMTFGKSLDAATSTSGDCSFRETIPESAVPYRTVVDRLPAISSTYFALSEHVTLSRWR